MHSLTSLFAALDSRHWVSVIIEHYVYNYAYDVKRACT